MVDPGTLIALSMKKKSFIVNVDYINTLGAGSGLNTKEIVSALVTAERAPEEARLNNKISESESEISALGIAKSRVFRG